MDELFTIIDSIEQHLSESQYKPHDSVKEAIEHETSILFCCYALDLALEKLTNTVTKGTIERIKALQFNFKIPETVDDKNILREIYGDGEHTPKEAQLLEKFTSKVGLQPVDATFLSIIKDNNNFIMQEPVIYRVENTDSYLIFGDFVSGYDLQKMQEHMKQYNDVQSTEGNCDSNHENCNHDEKVPVENDNGIKEDDVLMLVDQFDITKEEATDALRMNKNDPVETMMYLQEKMRK